jgi:hypothetical protein
MFVSISSAGASAAGFGVAAAGSVPGVEEGLAPYRSLAVGLMVVGAVNLMMRLYLAPRQQAYEAGRMQGRREMLKELNGRRRSLMG